MERLRTYGAEIEKPIADGKTGKPHRVSDNFFKALYQSAQERRISAYYHPSDLEPSTIIGVVSGDLGEQGLDNGWNLQETSLPYQLSLSDLQEIMELDLATVQKPLEQEKASIINLSIHPLCKRDLETYRAFVAPKRIYSYLRYRGWDHTAGIDARAQNSPTTGVDVWEAADAVSVIIGAGAAFIGLFANSPYEEGRRSPYKESRLTMWERMMKHAKVEGDRITAHFPPERFHTLAQYFNWMFGRGTGIHFVLAENPQGKNDYKGIGDRVLIIQGNPSVLEYLSQEEWPAFYLTEIMSNFPPSQALTVKPEISHMEAMQFAQFAGARIRYKLNHEGFPLQEFLRACEQPNTPGVEKIFEQWANYLYIEGRDPGANFPDEKLWEVGEEVAQSVVISPPAIQAGLIRNLSEASAFIDSFDWQLLKALRDAAIRDGLDGQVEDITVYDFAKRILEIAAHGLTAEEQKMLKYPLFVLETKQNGADRAIQFVESHKGDTQRALEDLVKVRRVVIK